MASDTTPKAAFGIAVTWAGHDVGYLTDVKGPSMSADIIDISNHDSPNGFKQFVAGMRDGGEVGLEMKYIPGDLTGQKFMLADFGTGTERQVVITFADTSTWTLNGVITAFDPDAGGLDTDRLLSITVKVNGKPVYAFT